MSWIANRRPALGDEFLESYVCWREACEDVRSAYRRRAKSSPRQRGLAFAAYRAALDREEYAAGVHFHGALKVRGAA
jgi:hypothetical protein